MADLRLNLGCGMNIREGYVNVDRFGEPDVRHDLEVVPWPWPDDSVTEILLYHVLEHLGRETDVYLAIMKEMYRVCQDGATIRVIVPHHRHEYFFNDPTHVRAITADGMTIFSQRLNREWIAKGISNTPLGVYLGIDFELSEVRLTPGALWHHLHPGVPVDIGALLHQGSLMNNLIEEVHLTLKAVKPAGRMAA